MTPTPGLAAQQQIPAPRAVRPGSNAEKAKESAPSQDTAGFDALYSRLRTQAGGSAQPAAEAGQADGQGQLRQGGEEQSKLLQAEDVLPLELLITLYAQPQAVLVPPAMPPALRELAAALPALESVPLPAMAVLPNAAALAQAALALEDVASALTARPPQDSLMAQTATMPQPAGDLRAQAAVPQAPAPAVLPMDFAEQLASAARPAATVANAPVATRRAPGLQADAVAPLDSTDPNAGEPAGVTASAPAAPAAKPLLEPKQAQAAPAQGAPVHVDVGAMPPRHSPSPSADRRADEASAARAAFRDVVAEQPGASGKRDGSVPERLREVQAVVTRQETVLAPAGQMPVAHQAADRIIAELQSSDDAAPADRAQTSRPGEAPAPVRTLHIQLQPADMGMLTVKLSMRAEMLDIKLEAAEHRTARLLEADRERLTDILRSAGYALDGVTVQISSSEKPVQTFNAMAGQGGNGQPQQGAQSGGAQADAQRGQGSQRGNDDGSVAAGNDGGDHGPRVGSADGDLYL